jgi:hypothetical protein
MPLTRDNRDSRSPVGRASGAYAHAYLAIQRSNSGLPAARAKTARRCSAPVGLDLVAPALDCEEFGDCAAADRLLAAAAAAVGDAGLRCLVSYRALTALAEDTREGVEPQADIHAISAILDRLN